MKTILLNCLPPAMENCASPALSVLKHTLQNNGFKTDVLYWNLKLNSFLRNYLNFGDYIHRDDIYKLLPFYIHIAIEENDQELLNKLAYSVLYHKPEIHSKGIAYLYSYFYEQDKRLIHIIKECLQSINMKELLFVGFSAKFSQWIVATIIAKEIKKIYKKLPIIIGGFGTPQEAQTILKNFNCFDLSSWGEGENSTLLLAQHGFSEGVLNKIPHICYRNCNTITSNKAINTYINLNNVSFDMSDYFSQIKLHKLPLTLMIPIEASRGCNWGRCKFCFLNKGYKFRTKSVKSVKNEILNYIEKFNCTSIFFLDNNIVANDNIRFDTLLDELINVRQKYNDFSIKTAEVTTKGLTFELIKKMSLANFESVQIGYESPSNTILKSIKKNNTFASNLFFIKWALQFGINLSGINILRNLLEEDDDGIKEGINNLFYMRFILPSKKFHHNISFLSVSTSSRYFKFLESNKLLDNWSSNTSSLLSEKIINKKDKYILFEDYTKKTYNKLWDIFKNVETYYIENEYKYKFIKNHNIITYREFLNNELINELEFKENEEHWCILTISNKKIVSINNLLSSIKNSNMKIIEQAICELEAEGLIYVNDTKTEILSIVDTDRILY